MSSKSFTKIKRKMVGNDLWDNGLYVYSDEVVNFPAALFAEKAIVEDFEIKFKIHTGDIIKKIETKVTLDGNSWIVKA